MPLLRRLFALLLLTLACAWGTSAQAADACTVSVTTVDFANISTISASDHTVTGTGTLSCLFSSLNLGQLVTPNARACISLGVGSNSASAAPRTLGNGSNRLQYNLYTTASYVPANIWGGAAVTGAPSTIVVLLRAPVLSAGTYATTFEFYGVIPAGTALAAVPVVGNNPTLYTSSFAGVGTFTYSLFGLIDLGFCTGNSGSFGFTASATAVNDCTITASPMVFNNASVLTGELRSTSTLSVRCVNANAYQIALNSGVVSSDVANRKMKNTLTTDIVSYRLSATLDGPVWGDGTAGTSMVSATGTGASVAVTVYGRVPAQLAPRPGDYKDTVTATIYF